MFFFQVFMKESLSYHLEDLKHSVTEKAVIVLQQMARGLLARKQYMREKRATLAVQSAIRSYLARYEIREYHFDYLVGCYVIH